MVEQQNLEEELKGALEGEVRFDPYSKILYSTDASMYRIEPIGVVIPRSSGDVQRALEIAARHSVPIIPRGGGTSLAGQTVGKGIVFDFSKFMNKVLEHNLEGEWARVQPGLVQDHFNDYLRPHGFVFGPNTSVIGFMTFHTGTTGLPDPGPDGTLPDGTLPPATWGSIKAQYQD